MHDLKFLIYDYSEHSINSCRHVAEDARHHPIKARCKIYGRLS